MPDAPAAAPRVEYMARDAFAELARKGVDPGAVRLWKSAPVGATTVERDADGKATRRVRVAISSANIDRDSDTVSLDGWSLDAYERNPVVLWAHSHTEPPIARSVELTADPPGASAAEGDPDEAHRRLWSVDEFPAPGLHALADTTFGLIEAGFLHATSVGFRPLTWMYNEERHGVDFDEHEMLEHSWVPVPANADAVLGAKAAGIDLSPALEWAERLLDAHYGEPMLTLSRDKVEAALAMLGKTTQLIPEPAQEVTAQVVADEIAAAVDRELRQHATRLTGRV